MPITDIFSKRGKPAPDVLQYETLPEPLRVQIVRIVDGVLRPQFTHKLDTSLDWLYSSLHGLLAHEYGVIELAKGVSAKARVDVFILRDAAAQQVLDVIEVAFNLPRGLEMSSTARLTALRDAVDETNARFREHGIGYQIEIIKGEAKVIRVGSTYAHQQIVRPVLAVLHAPHFKGAETEFLRAHEHYRHGRCEEAINECLKALESTLKVICGRRGWECDAEKDTANRLIDVVFSNRLIPAYLEGQFKGLRSVLEGGVPTIRNRSGGHGTGEKPRKVPEHLVAYALHSTAAAILFLVAAYESTE